MHKTYKILLAVIGLKTFMGITYMPSIISSVILYWEILEGSFGFDTFFRLLDWFLILTVSVTLLIGFVLQLLQKKMSLNSWLKLGILYYASHFIVVGLPSYILMDYVGFVTGMSTFEKLRFFTNTFTIIALITVYAVFLNQIFRNENCKVIENVSDQRPIRFLNYILDFSMVAHLSFLSSKHAHFQNWEYPFIFALIAVLYYFSLEVLFRQTIGKVVTNTYVSNIEYTFMWALLLRSLCRRIPFEPLSFFGKGRWHDTLSKTEIVKIDLTKTLEHE